MCGARRSDGRSPSRTTSWSSTMRQVILDHTAGDHRTALRCHAAIWSCSAIGAVRAAPDSDRGPWLRASAHTRSHGIGVGRGR
jgi:hypothetical protein